jgi:hypothetical protein
VQAVERQFVGGSKDGQRLTIESDYVYFDWTPTFIDVITFASPQVHVMNGEPERRAYREKAAPTGEWVMLLDGTKWPVRFDTEAWVRRYFPGRATWRRLDEPWLWRGDGVDTSRKPGEPGKPGSLRLDVLEGTATYVLGTPERPGELLACQYTIALAQIPDRELALAALAGTETLADAVIENLRRELLHELLPSCPVRACGDKASMTLTATAPVEPLHARDGGRNWRLGVTWFHPGQTLALCPQHASEELRRVAYNTPHGSHWRFGR